MNPMQRRIDRRFGHSTRVRTEGRVFPANIAAFTLIELLVVIAVIAILASLLMPALLKAKAKAQEAQCKNRVRQVAMAFTMYVNDYNDTFPAGGSKMVHGPQPEDWIWWQQDRDPTSSQIAPYIGDFNATVLRCPGDSEMWSMLGNQGNLTGDPYLFSYALTSYTMEDDQNFGMATIITDEREVYPFRMGSVINPSQKIMVAEETRESIDDGRWVPSPPSLNLLSERHSDGANVGFADGHVDHVDREFGEDLQNSHPRMEAEDDQE